MQHGIPETFFYQFCSYPNKYLYQKTLVLRRDKCPQGGSRHTLARSGEGRSFKSSIDMKRQESTMPDTTEIWQKQQKARKNLKKDIYIYKFIKTFFDYYFLA